jgi:hypothetical protein
MLKRWELGLTALLVMVHVGYVAALLTTHQELIDYQTFMTLGGRLMSGQEVYVQNSYYPLPTVMLFAFFDWLPRPLSIAVWHLSVTVVALLISGGAPWPLLFAPVFGHMVGGQTSVIAMLGLWGYRKNIATKEAKGGVWLALMLLKPQLALLPLGWAAYQWWKSIRADRAIPRQLWGFSLTALAVFLPSFIIMPDWPIRWLSQARPMFARALSGVVPRVLVMLDTPPMLFWMVLIGVSAALVFILYSLTDKNLTLDVLLIASFIVSPLVHDYDLVELVPMLGTPFLQWGAVLLSVPGWFVILFAYLPDWPWVIFTIIAPGLLILKVIEQKRTALATNSPPP